MLSESALERRVKAREAALRARPGPEQRRRDALSAVRDGTASADQVQLACASDIERSRNRLIARSAAVVARERAGLWGYGLERVAAYRPPDPLPQSLATELDHHFAVAELSFEQWAASEWWVHGPANPHDRKNRMDSILVAATCDDREAMLLRNRVWVLDAGSWTLSPAAHAAAVTKGLSARAADQFLGLTGTLVRLVEAGDLVPSLDAGLSYADIADSVERFGLNDTR